MGRRKSQEANVKPVATSRAHWSPSVWGPKRPGHYTDTWGHWAQTSLERHGLKSLLEMQMYHPDPRSKTLPRRLLLANSVLAPGYGSQEDTTSAAFTREWVLSGPSVPPDIDLNQGAT